jgi:NAD(P)-dependent dehydrogenase (short-subunit alcohol dehydrogenase family)
MQDKVVLITGASSGIGQETAYQFARAGARLALTYNRSMKRGNETEARCHELGAAEVLLTHLDVMGNDSIAEAVRNIQDKYDHIDILVNNAGAGVFRKFRDCTAEDIERQVRTNLEGPMKVTLALLPLVKETIINIGSYLAKNTMPDYAVYCGSKWGVRGFTRALAEEETGLKVVCVNPDYTATTMTDFGGRPPAEIADIVFKVAAGEIACEHGGDVDAWEILDT